MTINEILRLPEKIQCDKRMHFIIGVVASWFLATIGLQFYWIGLLTLVLAWGIEFYQSITKSGTYDNYDALYVILGSLPIIMLVAGVKL